MFEEGQVVYLHDKFPQTVLHTFRGNISGNYMVHVINGDGFTSTWEASHFTTEIKA